MARVADLRSRIASIQELQDVIGAMRALAAVRVRQALASLDAIRRYAETIGEAITQARMLVPEAPVRVSAGGRCLLVVLCTEHGFAGAFNDRLLERAAEPPRQPLLVVGSRGALLACERGLAVDWTSAAASHPSGVLELVRGVASELYRRIERGEAERVEVVYGRGGGAAACSVERERLFPPDLSRFRQARDHVPPLHHLEPERLLEGLAAELVLAELTRMAMESLAAENAARLHAMSAARENVDRKLEQLHQYEHRARQEEVTTELLDVVAGAEALRQRR